MKGGDIFKAFLNQIDGKFKYRPVLLLKKMPPFDDWLVCGITSKLQNKVDQFDILLNEDDKDFKETGLIMTILIRLGFLAVIPEKVIEGTIGSISSENYLRLLKNLITHLEVNI